MSRRISSAAVMRGLFLTLLLVLTACQPTQPRVVILPAPEPVVPDIAFNEEEYRVAFEQQLRYQRMIADLLFEGRKALNANRLLTPADVSAHAYFTRVLAIEPENAVALQGIQDIVNQYLLLTAQASRQGLFANAQDYLRRAEQVDRTHTGIASAWATLEAEMESKDVVHSLNARELASQSATMTEQLAQIALQARDSGAFFLITAPSDAQARWIYLQMQAAVEGHRLRGNIELGETPTIRLIMPEAGEA